MNEKIRELKEQAGITTNLDTDFYDKRDANKWMDYFAEQFARLIIEECQYVMDCNKGGDQHPEWNRALYETIFKIDKHFGIEE